MEYLTERYVIAILVLLIIALVVLVLSHLPGFKVSNLKVNLSDINTKIATALASKFLFNKSIDVANRLVVFKAQDSYTTAIFGLKDIILNVSELDPQPIIIGKIEKLDASHFLMTIDDRNASYTLLKGKELSLIEKKMKIKTNDSKL